MLGTTVFILGCQSSKSQVPEAVEIAFKEKYPGENDPDWEKDRNGNFESSFKIDGKKYRADFSPEGKWIETERSLKKKDLPKAIEEKLEKDFDDFDIVEIEEVQHSTKGLFYDVELKKDGKKTRC
jgi:hypothetical protein